MPFECPSLPCQLHATCVALDGRGLLIVGRSGVGKSTMALQLMTLGAELVADDRCDVSSSPLGVIASRPDNMPQAIEARGVGLLSAPCIGPTPIEAVLDLDGVVQDRLPQLRYAAIGHYNLPLLELSTQTNMPAVLFHFLKYGFHGSMGE